ncbi:EamA family transporter RarD [Staphylococcus massiliensis]|uniref:RarD protein n=2 Tax=Staphylococcus massiliensis TaxID=555791 RepID=K9AJN1_9STAP|nr:EamA family transporter RarD [Staphylococcus massiliensis]EKU47479.1 rarD protein [Staphylococcus massiliensis S46]MCG3401119.1 EamA family transporter RarD [Staphylococcus massiliensis]
MHQEFKRGIFLSLGAYILWGILPIYWSLVKGIGSFETLAFRIILSLIFMVILLPIINKTGALKKDLHYLKQFPTKFVAIVVAGYIITINWGTFIYAVDHGHVLQASLGYYINPLVSIVLALIFLKERFTKLEWIAIALATIGVIFMTLKIGEFPYISLLLAFSFGFYGLIKKSINIDALSSITIECIVTAPAGIIYIWYLFQTSQVSSGWNMSTFCLLFSGAITAIPLILFSAGAKRIPLSLVGFIQYVGPTLIFILGIFVFHEKFDINQLITFIFIWIGIILYSISKYLTIRKSKNPV